MARAEAVVMVANRRRQQERAETHELIKRVDEEIRQLAEAGARLRRATQLYRERLEGRRED